MAIVYPTPEEVASQYLTTLKGLKPEAVTDQTDKEDNDWYVRGRVTGGVASGLYSDQAKVADDPFPQHARRDALLKWIFAYFEENQFRPATQAHGTIKFTGDVGTTFPAGTQAQYTPNGNLYASDVDAVVGPLGSGTVAVTSVSVGQIQNLLEGAELTVSSPPANIDALVIVWDDDLKDGKNEETEAEASARILARMRAAIRGGTVPDYQQWAFEADNSVASANILRFAFGFGTLAVIITAGTTDIDTALDNGDPIVVEPSQEVIDNVQAYIDLKRPVTACPTVIAATELEVDVTCRVRFTTGDKDTVLSGQDPDNELTQGEFVEREIKRAIYKTPPGGRQFGTDGYVLRSELEEMIDFNLGAGPITLGQKLQIVTDRHVEDLAASGPNLKILGNQVVVPGTITILDF